MLSSMLFLIGALIPGNSQQSADISTAEPASAYVMMIDQGEVMGFRMGQEDGRRDLNNKSGYHPARRRYNAAPGYDPSMGPLPIYQDAYRRAYLRGYNQAFGRPVSPM